MLIPKREKVLCAIEKEKAGCERWFMPSEKSKSHCLPRKPGVRKEFSIHLNIYTLKSWRKKLKDLKRKRRATDVRLERVCKSDCLNLLNKENISKLKFLEIVKIVKNHQEPHFAHVLIVVIFIFHETLLLAYVKKI